MSIKFNSAFFLLSFCNANAAEFKYTSNMLMPFETNALSLYSYERSVCDGQTCVAIGTYANLSGGNSPLLAISVNGGVDWSTTIPTNTPLDIDDKKYSEFYETSCNNQVCTAVGKYANQNNSFSSLLAVSVNSAKDWHYVSVANDPDDHSRNSGSMFIGTSCAGQTCSAIGAYVNEYAGTSPLLAVSTDAGNTWNYITPEKAPDNINFYSMSTLFYDTSCNGMLCTAVGQYSTLSGAIFGLLTVSTDGGKNWEYVNPTNLPLDLDFKKGLSLYKTGCTENGCWVSGLYVDSAGDTLPLYGVSDNAGKNWTY